MFKITALALAVTTLLVAGCNENRGNAGTSAKMYATDGDTLFTLSTHEGLVTKSNELSGLNSGTLLYAIDVNPRGGALHGLGSDGQIYIVDTETGSLTPQGSPDTSVSFTNKTVEIDYNPRAGAGTANEGKVFRVTTNTGDNYRRNDTTGAKLATDTAFAYKTGDVNAGKSVTVSGIAYTNSQVNTAVPASTVVYAIDSQNNVLARLGGSPANTAACPNATNPDCGQLTTIGPLGVDAGDFVGFDIYNSNFAFATTFVDGTYSIYTVDLTSGLMTFITGINPKITPLRSIALAQ